MEGAPKDDELSTFTMIENSGESTPPETILIGDTGLNQTSFSPFGPGAILFMESQIWPRSSASASLLLVSST